jgi:hypothetical protein|tara:strand:- start:190 stop:612 length:423 start_codon:yes stop_codon:yes gene_type:complete
MPENVDQKLREDRKRIIALEGDVSTLKVETAKIFVTLDQSDIRAGDRHEATKTAQIEIKDLLKRRIEVDEEREKDAREYRQEREKLEREAQLTRQKWAQSLLNPQTLIIILAVALSLFGVQVADLWALTTPPTAQTPQSP